MTENKKQVLAILGSPYRNGKTAAMMDIAICRAEKRDYVVTKINLYEKIYDFDFLQYSIPIFMDIWTKQRGNTKYGRFL